MNVLFNNKAKAALICNRSAVHMLKTKKRQKTKEKGRELGYFKEIYSCELK